MIILARILDSLFAGAFTFLVFLLALSLTHTDSRFCALVALIAAYCAFVVTSVLLKKKPKLSFRKRRVQAARRVKALIYADTSNALMRAFRLISCRYPMTESVLENGSLFFTFDGYRKGALTVLQKLKVSPDDILSTWRTHRGSALDTLIVAVPGRSEQDILVTAARLTDPSVLVFHQKQLRSFSYQYDKEETPEIGAHRPRSLQTFYALITRRRARRYLLYSLLLYAYFILWGHWMYLAASLVLLTISLIGLSKPMEPETLSR